MKPVPLTQDYRLNGNDRNFIVEERYTVDPTRAPGYKAIEGEVVPESYDKWREAAYYPLSSRSLAYAIDYVVTRTVARSDAESLSGLVAAFRAEYQRVTDVINTAFHVPEDDRIVFLAASA